MMMTMYQMSPEENMISDDEDSSCAHKKSSRMQQSDEEDLSSDEVMSNADKLLRAETQLTNNDDRGFDMRASSFTLDNA